jgi:hypothetical protein
MRNNAPRPDWCRIESVMPSTTVPRVSFLSTRRAFSQCAHSAMVGENSMNSATMYSRKCQQIRNSTELNPNELPI